MPVVVLVALVVALHVGLVEIAGKNLCSERPKAEQRKFQVLDPEGNADDSHAERNSRNELGEEQKHPER